MTVACCVTLAVPGFLNINVNRCMHKKERNSKYFILVDAMKISLIIFYTSKSF